MNEESEKFIKAEQILKGNDFDTEPQLELLQAEYSQHLELSSKYDGDIRHFKYEIRMCDEAIVTEAHVKKQMQKVERLNENNKKIMKNKQDNKQDILI